ncbi:MAG TPA: hypothetical protein VLC71_13005 [Thermomonas sp.]|nr:hypothetical protein [Thermomonas sp.]
MRRPHAGESLGLGFDHCTEIVTTMGALLLQVKADGGEVVVADRLRKHRAIPLGTERTLDGMRCQQRISAQPTKTSAA